MAKQPLGPDDLPASFGRYRLIKLLGEGGMGRVYQWSQTLPKMLQFCRVTRCISAFKVLRSMSNPAASYARTYVEQAIALAQQGRLDEAAVALGYALQWQPGYGDALRVLAAVQFARGNFREAMDCYEEILQHQPADATAHQGRGEVLQHIGQLEEALSSYERVLELQPGNADVWNNVGVLRKARGDLDGAITAYREALRYRPAFAPAHSNLERQKGVRIEWHFLALFWQSQGARRTFLPHSSVVRRH